MLGNSFHGMSALPAELTEESQLARAGQRASPVTTGPKLIGSGSERKTPSENAPKSNASKGVSHPLGSERESNDSRSQLDRLPDGKAGGRLVPMC